MTPLDRLPCAYIWMADNTGRPQCLPMSHLGLYGQRRAQDLVHTVCGGQLEVHQGMLRSGSGVHRVQWVDQDERNPQDRTGEVWGGGGTCRGEPTPQLQA